MPTLGLFCFGWLSWMVREGHSQAIGCKIISLQDISISEGLKMAIWSFNQYQSTSIRCWEHKWSSLSAITKCFGLIESLAVFESHSGESYLASANTVSLLEVKLGHGRDFICTWWTWRTSGMGCSLWHRREPIKLGRKYIATDRHLVVRYEDQSFLCKFTMVFSFDKCHLK